MTRLAEFLREQYAVKRETSASEWDAMGFEQRFDALVRAGFGSKQPGARALAGRNWSALPADVQDAVRFGYSA